MKIAYRIALAFLLTGFTTAQAKFPTLQESMKSLGESIKVLSTGLLRGEPLQPNQILSASQNALLSATAAAHTLPTHLLDGTGRPLEREAEAIASYNKIMNRLVQGLSQVHNLIVLENPTGAAQVLRTEVLPLARQGHMAFRKH